MLTKVEIINEGGDLLELPLQKPSNGVQILDIDGLDPVKATISASAFALNDGEEEQASHREPRSLTFKIKMLSGLGTDVVQSARFKLYSFFMPKAKVIMRFYGSGFPVVEIRGTVEDFQAPQFVKDPIATLSIYCAKPAFYTNTLTDGVGHSTSGSTSDIFPYIGSIENGFLFRMTVDRTVTNFILNHNYGSRPTSILEFVGNLAAGDTVELSTVEGDKSATRIRAGVRTSILSNISPKSDWINLWPGSNQLRVYCAGAPMLYTITYRTLFGGL